MPVCCAGARGGCAAPILTDTDPISPEPHDFRAQNDPTEVTPDGIPHGARAHPKAFPMNVFPKKPSTNERSWRPRKLLLVAALATVVGVTGCLDRELRPLNPCTISGVAESVKVDNIENVDLLFMVDNSNSMSEEQVALSNELPRLVRVLASGDADEDGTQDFPPVRSLQIGVVSSDMGTGGFLVPTCSESSFGDDGVLRTEGNVARPGCMATYPSFLSFRPADGGDPSAFASDVTCVAAMGTNGCGFEQQLESILKAVTPSTSSITFGMGTVGHADGANAGFIRDNSLLTIINVTDEDDCSAADPDLFNPSSTAYTGDLNLRCFQYPEAVHPVERFVNGLLATRTDPDLLVYAAITGIPPEVNPDPDAATDYASILGHPMMQEMIDPSMPTRLAPSCVFPSPGGGPNQVAFPPRRIVTVAQQLEGDGANAVVQTLCQESFTGALQAVINKIADVLGGTCLPRALTPDASGLVNCDVVEVLPAMGDVTSCEGVEGREFLRTEVNEAGMEVQVCRVTQLSRNDIVDPSDLSGQPPGWFYDDAVFNPDVAMRCPESRQQRITFTRPPVTGTTVRLECLQTVGAPSGTIGIGTSCDADPAVCGSAAIPDGFAMNLLCDNVGGDFASNTCQAPCGTDADCAGGYVCFDSDADGPRPAFCANPTCDN